MARIFLSYSRVDRPFVDNFVPLLHEVYGYDNIWFDAELHGGQVWWDEILHQIARCDVFVFLMSNEALTSSYCLAELAEARRLGKQILPVLIRARTNIPDDLSSIQFVDLSRGAGDLRGLNRFHAAIQRQIQQISAHSPELSRTEPITIPIVPVIEKPRSVEKMPRGVLVAGAVGVVLVIALVLLLSGSIPLFQALALSSPEMTASAVATIDIGQMTETLAVQQTAAAQATHISRTMTQVADNERATQTQLAGLTATATLRTPTPSPRNTSTPRVTSDLSATISARIDNITNRTPLPTQSSGINVIIDDENRTVDVTIDAEGMATSMFATVYYRETERASSND